MLSIVRDRGTDGGIAAFSAMICKHIQIITFVRVHQIKSYTLIGTSKQALTLEHISCRAEAMVLAGASQRNTWHFSMHVSLSLATKAKSLQRYDRPEQDLVTPNTQNAKPCPYSLLNISDPGLILRSLTLSVS